MPLYEFQLVGGREVISRYFPATECPELGSVIEVDGRKFRRILSAPGGVQVKNFAHVSHSLPKNCKGAPHYDRAGHPAFETQKEVREFAAANNMHWD